jgi:hypothetical protein
MHQIAQVVSLYKIRKKLFGGLVCLSVLSLMSPVTVALAFESPRKTTGILAAEYPEAAFIEERITERKEEIIQGIRFMKVAADNSAKLVAHILVQLAQASIGDE